MQAVSQFEKTVFIALPQLVMMFAIEIINSYRFLRANKSAK